MGGPGNRQAKVPEKGGIRSSPFGAKCCVKRTEKDGFQAPVGMTEKALIDLATTILEVKADVEELEKFVSDTVTTIQGQRVEVGKRLKEKMCSAWYQPKWNVRP